MSKTSDSESLYIQSPKTIEEEIDNNNNNNEDDNYVDDDYVNDDYVDDYVEYDNNNKDDNNHEDDNNHDDDNHEDELTSNSKSSLAKYDKKRKITKSNTKTNKKTKKTLTSFVWNHCTRTIHPDDPSLKIATCQYKFTTGKNAGEICGHGIETKGLTGNIHTHLATHGITSKSKPTITSVIKLLTQGTLDSIVTITKEQKLKHNPVKQQELVQLLVMWIIDDQQPLHVLQNKAFIRFINSLDPLFDIPSDKIVKQQIHIAYNLSTNLLIEKFKVSMISCSVTFDLWTARSGEGYLGITCTFIDEHFYLQEVVLACKRLEYPYTSEAIKESLLLIFTSWGIEKKVFTYTTDNGSNMVKLSKIIPCLKQVPCAAHTIQLVIGKGLLHAEVLITRAKRLINWFKRPKQTERLINAQKILKKKENKVNLIYFNIFNFNIILFI